MSTPTTNRRVHVDPSMPDRIAATPSKGSARRALGELTPNKRVSSQKPGIMADKTQPPRNLSPLKQARPPSLAQDENAYGISNSRKRSIDDVDSAHAREDLTAAPTKRVDGRAATQASVHALATNMQASAQLASQIIDLARRDLTPTDEDYLEPVPQGTQETTGTRASFSSLIDYNPHGSSQQTSSSPPLRATKPPTTTVRADSIEFAHHDVRHTEFGAQRAEALRLRLRVALYKVKTGQTHVPLSCLEIPREYRRKPAEKADAPSRPTYSSVAPALEAKQTSTAPAITVTGEDEVEEGLSNTRSSEQSAPKLLPAPVLMPTAYSTRFITEPQTTTVPSSPPNLANTTATAADRGSSTPRGRGSSGSSSSLQEFVTPVANRHAATQLSSPPYSENHVRHRAPNDSDNLTSSGVKDRAADALLKLTRSV
ncbi:guanyl-nucleotide exchange factor [Diplodia corticola]|uniref:Guanyl-nucleotide exchange factor n=1 Tax=Diplodia corticola TaxID=236234 RepID=A0A1J9RUN6_9PEZI|nr:guanyl-nucleotide exchange factor [Diplodia corticola]OJD36299.1 guanyl-nucleotide exchange factor [Diplodia corticola]